MALTASRPAPDPAPPSPPSLTPRLLRRMGAVLVVLLALAGAVGVYTADVRDDAVEQIKVRVEPLSVDATELYRALADADAAGASEFLATDADAAARRARYDAEINLAMTSLLHATTLATGDLVTSARLTYLGQQIPVYTGLVERARADRQLNGPAATTLRTASDLMRLKILPRAQSLQASQADHLDAEYRSAGATPTVAIALACAAVVGLVGVQVVVARCTRRRLNAGLMVATVLVGGTAVWWTVAGAQSSEYLQRSQTHSDAVADGLAPARIAALQARGREGLVLASGVRTGDDQYFSERMDLLARDQGAGGALGAARAFVSDPTGDRLVDTVSADVTGYRAAHGRVRALDDANRQSEAVQLALALDNPESAANRFAQLDTSLDRAITYEREAFAADIRSAQYWRTGLIAGTGLLALAAAVSAALGVGRRLRDYRP